MDMKEFREILRAIRHERMSVRDKAELIVLRKRAKFQPDAEGIYRAREVYEILATLAEEIRKIPEVPEDS